jgi:hypothetical protein
MQYSIPIYYQGQLNAEPFLQPFVVHTKKRKPTLTSMLGQAGTMVYVLGTQPAKIDMNILQDNWTVMNFSHDQQSKTDSELTEESACRIW